MAVLEQLDEEEMYLWALLSDPSGLDQSEWLWEDYESPNGVFRAWSYQWKWFRCDDPLQIDQAARAVGKSLSIKMRAFAFPFLHPGQEMLITAPELVHLNPIIGLVENQLLNTKLTRELLPKGRSAGITHRPFECDFLNGARIFGRIPQRDGKGVKGSHPLWLEMDECFPFDTLILTQNGFIPIGEVTVGQKVLTHEKRWRKVTATYKRGVKEAIEIRGHGHPGLVCTPDHLFYAQPIEGFHDNRNRWGAFVGDVPEWFPARKMEDAFWAAPCGFDPEVEIPREIPRARTGPNNQPLPINAAFLWCLGCYIAEGSTSKTTPKNDVNKATWSLHKDEVVTVIEMLRRAGLHGFSQPVQASENAMNVVVAYCMAARFLKEHCGIGAPNKKIPLWVFGLNEEQRRTVFEGLIFGDGFDDPDIRYAPGRKKLATCSKALAFGARLLGLSLGYSVSIHVTYGRTTPATIRGREVQTGIGYQVVFNTVGQGFERDELYWTRVRKIKESLPVEMFDLEVEEDHSFIAEGIIVHNSQNYPEAGWIEVIETLKRGHENAVWRAHGVSRGVRDYFYRFTQPKSGWTTHRITAMHRPNWSDQERKEKIEQYGSRDNPDYRRNLLGLHGSATNPMLELGRLMACVDDDITSDYNQNEYVHFRINAEMVADAGDILELLKFPSSHKNPAFLAFWIGQDVGYLNHPSEIAVFAELKGMNGKPSWLKLLTRIHLERISHGDQVRTILHTINWYQPKAYAMDKNGIGLPLFQDIQDNWPQNALFIKGYTFQGKILVDFDKTVEIDEYKGDLVKEAGIERNVLEYSSDTLRDYVDSGRILFPWDTDMLAELQGQTFTVMRDTLSLYGKKSYNNGKFHMLDAIRFALLGKVQTPIEQFVQKEKYESVAPIFIGF